MTRISCTYFLEPHAGARGNGAPNPTLRVYPAGVRYGSVTFQISDDMPMDDRVRVAEELLRGAQQFRNAVVADAERHRTAQDELAEAREEITRLRAEAGEDA
ncbi:hypothetical protein [Streptomyces sp. NPDC021224]|uniref:hypothetical protein n=1 Tax=unclassified Streptomyces TaxID=2593676 RepID=UPI0037BC7488